MDKLSQDYLKRAKIRLEVLEVFYNEGDYADVVREARFASYRGCQICC